jgi:hypothetical protein
MISSDSPFFGVPSQIADLSGNLVDFVERAVGIRPDFTPETLSLVDHYANETRVALKTRPEVLDLTAQALGAYFGEVLRRSKGAFWQVPTPNFHDWSLCGTGAFIMINPIGVGYDAIAQSTDHKGPSSQLKLAAEDRAHIQARLDSLPEVPDTEFYLLTTRLEALDIVIEGLITAAQARGYEDMNYTAEDYRTDLRPLGDF